MSHMNRVIIMGNLAANPELRQVAGGKSLAKMQVAVNRSWRGSDGTQQKRVDFFRVVAWSSVAENCARYLTKGRPVLVEGSLLNRSWDGPDGKKRWATDITAHAVHFLNGRDTPPGLPSDTPQTRIVAEADDSSPDPHPMHAVWDGDSSTTVEEEEPDRGPEEDSRESTQNHDSGPDNEASSRTSRGRSSRPTGGARRPGRPSQNEVPF